MSAVSVNFNRYDRQLRLWGDHGQRALVSGHVCLINATGSGTEALKSLVLAGFGKITIIDSSRVQEGDLGVNFFIDNNSIDCNKGHMCRTMLLRHNDEVNIHCLDNELLNILEHQLAFFDQFDVVVCCNVSELSLSKLAEYLWTKNIPLLVIAAMGMVGYLRVCSPEHTIVESHPDYSLEDLRFDRPLPEFVEFCNSINLSELSSDELSHIPWMVLVYKALEQWKHFNVDNYDFSKSDVKRGIKGILLELLPSNQVMLENFEEAINLVNKVLVPSVFNNFEKPDCIYNDDKCLNLSVNSSPFWIIAHAVKKFLDVHNVLPLRGSIPDMHSDSSKYLQLQKIFQQAAERDILEVRNYMDEAIRETFGSNLSLAPIISDDELRLFCKNAAFARVIRTRSICSELTEPLNPSLLTTLLESEVDDTQAWYLIWRVVFKFYDKYGRYPGQDMSDWHDDVAVLRQMLGDLIGEDNMSNLDHFQDHLVECCRWSGYELHSVAAFIGAVAGHEVIKLVSRQFLPIDDTLLYSATHGERTVVLKM